MKRLITILTVGLLTLLSTVMLAVPASANNFHMCADNGSQPCVGIATLDTGDRVYQVSDANARNMTFTPIDNNCTPRTGFAVCQRIYITFYNGDYLATDDNCNAGGPIVRASTDTTGIVWEESIASGTIDYELNNQHCANGGTALMGADGVFPHDWETDFNVMSGILYRFSE